jgi:ElaB/YqjD/DUF883 family membrane-anchored ribosome-binding protein
LLGLVKSIPGPVFLIGSGLFLMGSPTGQKVNAAAKNFAGYALGRAETASGGLRDAGAFTSDRFAQARDTAYGAIDSVARTTSDAARNITDAAAGLPGTVSAGVGDWSQNGSEAVTGATRAIRESTAAAAAIRSTAQSAVDYSTDTAGQLKAQAMDAPRRVSDALNVTVRENPILVAGVALGVGMLLASALPRSNIERAVAGSVAHAAKMRAAQLAAQGFQAAKGAAVAAVSEVAERAHDKGLAASGPQEAGRNLRNRIHKVGENAAGAARDVSQQQTDDPSQAGARHE